MRFFAFLLAAALYAQVSVPRPAPEFQIVEPSGHAAKLSSLRGHVVLLAFVLTTCSHCQEASRDFEKLRDEFGARGFDVLEAAFNENADVTAYARQFGLSFPIGIVNRSDALSFLGIRGNVRIGTPQVVLIDRIGMIRAQSAPEGSPLLQSADVLRGLIDALSQRHAIQ